MPRVLIIEDDPVNRELVLALLEVEGCAGLVAESADEGLALARHKQPDLILMDVGLPGMSGYEATRHLKEDPLTARIPVVVLTAYAMIGEEAAAREAGCDAYLAKPLDSELFRTLLRRFLFRESTHPQQEGARHPIVSSQD
jgi:two-component system cell cycle response regulator DivK